jgi:hypothetical protein
MGLGLSIYVAKMINIYITEGIKMEIKRDESTLNTFVSKSLLEFDALYFAEMPHEIH